MRAFILALCVALAAAGSLDGEEPLESKPRLFFAVPVNSNPIVCRKGTTLINKGNYYKAGAGVITQACQAKYETACATPNGVVLCNEHDAICKDTERSNDADINPLIAKNMMSDIKPQECASAGIFVHPEAWIISTAQTCTAFVLLIVAAAVAYIASMGRVSTGVVVIFWSIILTCILLTVSFYYLNAFVGVMAACIALSVYATRDTRAVPIGMLAAILAIMWFTFDGGLGFYQHHSRFSDSNAYDPALPFMETQCNQYYRFSIATPSELTQDKTNPNVYADAICLRNWLAAEYFFVILLKLELALLVAAGGSALFPAPVATN